MDAPDIHNEPKFIAEDVVEILYSRKKTYRAIITRTQQHTFHIRRERWDLSDWDIIGEGYWNPDDPFTTLTDRLDTARTLAREKLAETFEGFDTDP